MAYPASRSMNAELSEGSTDGKYKKVVRDRGGVVEGGTLTERADLDDRYYGIHEKQVKVAPDGLLHATPDFARTAAVKNMQRALVVAHEHHDKHDVAAIHNQIDRLKHADQVLRHAA
jgi:hypothetical protein